MENPTWDSWAWISFHYCDTFSNSLIVISHEFGKKKKMCRFRSSNISRKGVRRSTFFQIFWRYHTQKHKASTLKGKRQFILAGSLHTYSRTLWIRNSGSTQFLHTGTVYWLQLSPIIFLLPRSHLSLEVYLVNPI